MKLYKMKIKAARPVEVWAEDEKEAFNLAFDETEWDYDVETLEEKEDEE